MKSRINVTDFSFALGSKRAHHGTVFPPWKAGSMRETEVLSLLLTDVPPVFRRVPVSIVDVE